MSAPAFLITGCGRSGTRFIAELLRSLGCDTRHERTGGTGTACWYCCMLFENNVWQNPQVTRCGCQFPNVQIDTHGEMISSVARPRLRDHYDVVLHQTRSPMEVIASARTLTEGSYRFIDNKIGIRQYADPVLQATFYWVEWNRSARRMSDLTYRIEDLDRRSPEICDVVGVPFSMRKRDVHPAQRAHSRPHGSVSADYIRTRDRRLYDDLLEAAESFGYDLRCANA